MSDALTRAEKVAAEGGETPAEPAKSEKPVSDREQRILGIIETARSKKPKFKDERITMSHGAGGKSTQTLIEGLFVPGYGAESLAEMGDAGNFEIALPSSNPVDPGREAEESTGSVCRLAMTTDTFVVKPIRFPGGSIGELAVNGTVNDLAMAGARPQALTIGMVLEEGLESDDLRGEVEAIAKAAEAAGVEIVGGDTKVVERGLADSMYICTTGVGQRDPRATLSPAAVRSGDRMLVSGNIGEHGTAIMLARGELGLDADIVSDTRSLWPAADALLDVAGSDLRCMRDATRGGVASVLNEIARASGVSMLVSEARIPTSPTVNGAAEILGIDPMYVANEGVLVAFVAPESADAALEALRALPGCEAAADLGEVGSEPPGMVLVETAFGGRRVMDLLAGDPLPRIC